ncbi:MAG: glycoside hydrolase family 15 protein, partial [Caulobacteraceae bacterium]
MAEPQASAIGDYALIGDCETAALVGRGGAIDWLCWPRFDSDACFAALLGAPTNGRWLLAPAGPARVSRRYREGALVLETLFETESGAVALIDFMPPRSEASHVVRLVEGRRGRLAMRMELTLRFGYGQTIPWVRRLDGRTLSAVAGPSQVLLRSSVEARGEAMSTVAEFQVAEGETQTFVLSHGASHLPQPADVDPAEALDETTRFWRGWDAKSDAKGPYEAAVRRSLIVLKAMTFAPTGAIVAAPTTSLPEKLGGQRNWDDRFCWIRDASLTLLALMNGGHREEASAWLAWLQRSVAGDPADMRIMYGLGGERRLSEWEADWLAGYAGSKPVRIGNAAHSQFQLDVYGELMDAFHQARLVGLDVPPTLWN